MINYITASMLYDWIQCPQRVYLDQYGDNKMRDEISPFVKLLWERGNAFETKVINDLKIPYTDLSKYAGEEKEKATLEAMDRGDELIYNGRIKHGILLGVPDLLKKRDNGYVPGDIKSGAGLESSSDIEGGKPKAHYAVQIALYSDILDKMGYLADNRPFIWDVHGMEVEYNLDDDLKKNQTMRSFYREILSKVSETITLKKTPFPALSAICKLCHWRSLCKKELIKKNDLTLIPELGRSKRDQMITRIKNVNDFAFINIDNTFKFKGISINGLIKFQNRARLLIDKEAKPVITSPLDLPVYNPELFFDIETDPMRDFCYLHGFVLRKNQDKSTEKFVAFYADDPNENDEKEAFAGAVDFIRQNQSCMIYYYSKYERTFWRNLQVKYPSVISIKEIEDIFSPAKSTDLYFDVVKKKIEWPTYDHSIKTLAQYLGFSWRDTDPSGASSIEWYHRWVESKDPEIKKRILEYNEDDCRATRVLLDGIRSIK